MSEFKPDFDLFLRQLKSRKADPVLRYIRSFINNFINGKFTAEQQSKLVKDFGDFIFEQLTIHQPFSILNEKELLNAKFGIEKLVMTKIYSYCYSPDIKDLDESHKEDVIVDKQMDLAYTKYSNLTYKDLDVDEQLVLEGEKYIKLAALELNKVSDYKAPRAKIVCLLNACKILFQLIKTSNQHQNADEFLPLLVFTCLKGELKNLYSNLKYIERFSLIRNSEAEYYLVSLTAAVEYIRQLDKELEKTQEKENLINL